jgi:hypothetical protein
VQRACGAADGRRLAGRFLARNGLAVGRLYARAADGRDRTPEQLRGLGEWRQGRLLLLTVMAHTLRGGTVTAQDLHEGGQVLFLRR